MVLSRGIDYLFLGVERVFVGRPLDIREDLGNPVLRRVAQATTACIAIGSLNFHLPVWSKTVTTLTNKVGEPLETLIAL